jgi:uncharacterized protein
MNTQLSALEARVIGCLIEKQITTPDQYPLSLNALTNACNQKSNRDPVLALDERTVQETLDGLVRKHLVIEKSGFGSRVPKYQHVFCNTQFGSLQFSPAETGIVAELLLRGAQTPGELRARASRFAPIADVQEVETALDQLERREDGPFVLKLAREPGRRESRYAHLFSGEPAQPAAPAAILDAESAPLASSANATTASSATDTRVAALEEQVAELRREVDELKKRVS